MTFREYIYLNQETQEERSDEGVHVFELLVEDDKYTTTNEQEARTRTFRHTCQSKHNSDLQCLQVREAAQKLGR